jgi:hypothetical protein
LRPGLAFLLERFELRNDRRHQLNDDRGRDVGHDAEREDRHALHGAARQHVEHVEQAALLLLICWASAAGSMPGIGMKVPRRATISTTRVKKMRCRSSFALPNDC